MVLNGMLQWRLIEEDGEMRVEIRIKETGMDDCPFQNLVEVFGFRKEGLKLQDIIEIAEDNSGDLLWRKGFAVFSFPSEKGGTDAVEVDNFIANLEEMIGQRIQCRNIEEAS